MFFKFFKLRTIWWPTWPGWLLMFFAFGLPSVLWLVMAESFLSLTERQPADVLVVEGWIGIDGVKAAKAEFERGGYQWLVTAGAQFRHRWGPQQWNYATEAEEILLRAGVPAERVIAAPARDTEGQRTFQAALAVRQLFDARGMSPKAVNVFTIGAHARRSRLIFSKALSPDTKVGCISWTPSDYHPSEPWWKSSDRADDLIKESAGYWLELLFNSGRMSNSRSPPGS